MESWLRSTSHPAIFWLIWMSTWAAGEHADSVSRRMRLRCGALLAEHSLRFESRCSRCVRPGDEGKTCTPLGLILQTKQDAAFVWRGHKIMTGFRMQRVRMAS